MRNIIIKIIFRILNVWFIGTIGSFIIVSKISGLTCIDLGIRILLNTIWFCIGLYCYKNWETKYNSPKACST